MDKEKNAYKTISEVAKIIGLFNKKKGTVSTHTIRFWEKEFKQIKPKILAGKRRYYNSECIQTLKHIKYLLKDKGMTIKGVKNLLNQNKSLILDENYKYNIRNELLNKKQITTRIQKITKIIKDIKNLKDG